MSDIEKISKIKPELLSSENYFLSLLEQTYMSKMLTDNQLEKIKYDCLSLLAKQTDKYNSGDSSSIRVEEAQHLLDSIMFTIGVYLKTYQNLDEALDKVLVNDISELYKMGLKRIDRQTKSTKMLYSLIINNLIQTKNLCYNSTIVDGIKGFFKLYYPEFAAQEIHITADYPVYNQMEKLQGIEFIQKYLECIYYENLFCSKFSTEDIHYLLCGFDKDYSELVFNIYEQVLIAAIGCILSGGNVYKLEMAPSSIKILIDLFSGKNKNETVEILQKAVEQLTKQLDLTHSLKTYISDSLSQIANEIVEAVELRTLDRIFIIPKYPNDSNKITFSFGEKMDDERYRKVLEEITQCRYLTDKIAIIKSQIHSLADLEDVLLDSELSEEEIINILGILNPAEIAALIDKHPKLSELDTYNLTESQITLSHCLQKFLDMLPTKQQEIVNKITTMF